MAVTVSVYDQAATVFSQGLVNFQGDAASGAITSTDQFSELKVALFNDFPLAPFDQTHTSFSTGPQAAGTEVTTGGLVAGGSPLTGAQIIKTSNDSYLDADDFDFTATGADISANWAVLYVTGTNRSYDPIADRPLLHINFGQVETAADTTAFKIVWSSQGIFSFVVA